MLVKWYFYTGLSGTENLTYHFQTKLKRDCLARKVKEFRSPEYPEIEGSCKSELDRAGMKTFL